MADPTAPDAETVPSRDECMAASARLLRFAEGETDLAKMSAYDDLAQTWINLASLHDGA